MLLDTRTEDWDVLVVFDGPTVVNAALVLTDLLADRAVDAEGTVTDEDTATLVVFLCDVENCALLPLVTIVHVDLDVFTFLICPAPTPFVILLRLRLELHEID